MPIAKLLLAMALLFVMAPSVLAQSPVPNGDVAPGRADPYAHDPYITSTGATVANPGKSQSGGTTSQDRAIQRQDNKIDRSICKGC